METDILVIGSGLAGIYFALKVSKKAKVIIATKGTVSESNSYLAQGGIAAVFSKEDSIKKHVDDTLVAGDGLSNPKIAEIVAKESPLCIKDLLKLGVPLDKKAGKLILSREAAHSMHRIVHAKDHTGKIVHDSLVLKVKKTKNIDVKEKMLAIDLIVEDNRCIGCIFLDLNTNEIFPIYAEYVVLATGGIGQIFQETTNPRTATGDGIAMAFRAGAILEDMEFMQFHPTTLFNEEYKKMSGQPLLLSETMRGEGGILRNRYGDNFMKRYHPLADLAPRDIVSRISYNEMQKNGSSYNYLDMTHIDRGKVITRFPYIYEECKKVGIDMAKDKIPVVPAAHYLCGGIKTDEYAETSIDSLYAIGECACTELHGANRLASNSLAECLIFASRLAKKIKLQKKVSGKFPNNLNLSKNINSRKILRIKNKARILIWDYAGLIRNKKNLLYCLKKIYKLQKKLDRLKLQGISKELIEAENALLLSKIVVISCLRRKESRGCHYISDYPEKFDSVWRKHLLIDKNYFLQKRN